MGGYILVYISTEGFCIIWTPMGPREAGIVQPLQLGKAGGALDRLF